jgi:hypothetical protein
VTMSEKSRQARNSLGHLRKYLEFDAEDFASTK